MIAAEQGPRRAAELAADAAATAEGTHDTPEANKRTSEAPAGDVEASEG